MDLIDLILGRRPSDFASRFGESELHPHAIGDDDGDRYLEFPERGLSIVVDDADIARTIQLYALDQEANYSQYQGQLPGGMTFASSREEARRAFGDPERSEAGGEGQGMFGGFLYPWDRFLLPDRIVHLEYSADAETIRLVSISTLPELPRGN